MDIMQIPMSMQLLSVFPDSLSRVFIAGATSQAGDADAGKRIIRGMKEATFPLLKLPLPLLMDNK